MLDELSVLFDVVQPSESRSGYTTAIVDENVLGKQTVATRKRTDRFLRELYSFDTRAPVFRVLRRFWGDDTRGRALIALLCALARDRLLRATVEPILSLREGEELSRQKVTDAIRSVAGGRLNDAIVDKVVRNASSSWTQSGHLRGRARKFRQKIRPTPLSTAYALMLGYLEGLRGGRVFETRWTRTLDASPMELRNLAAEGKRLGVLDLKTAGDVTEVGFGSILTPQEIRDSHVAP